MRGSECKTSFPGERGPGETSSPLQGIALHKSTLDLQCELVLKVFFFLLRRIVENYERNRDARLHARDLRCKHGPVSTATLARRLDNLGARRLGPVAYIRVARFSRVALRWFEHAKSAQNLCMLLHKQTGVSPETRRVIHFTELAESFKRIRSSPHQIQLRLRFAKSLSCRLLLN